MSQINASTRYLVQGPTFSIAEMAKSRPGMVISATDEQIAEFKLYAEQTQAREDAIRRQAAENPSKIFAQIIHDGKALAIVYDSGSAGTVHHYPELSMTEHGSGLDLAKTRLQEIRRVIPEGKIIYSNFIIPDGPAPAVINEDLLPKVTARNLTTLIQEMSWMQARALIDTPETTK